MRPVSRARAHRQGGTALSCPIRWRQTVRVLSLGTAPGQPTVNRENLRPGDNRGYVARSEQSFSASRA